MRLSPISRSLPWVALGLIVVGVVGWFTYQLQYGHMRSAPQLRAGRIAQVQNDFRQLAPRLRAHYRDEETWPEDLGSLPDHRTGDSAAGDSATGNSATGNSWKTDPFTGDPYQYSQAQRRLSSAGPDGVHGSADDITVEVEIPTLPLHEMAYLANSALPAAVVARAGAVTLYVDYSNAATGELLAYLVNRTAEPFLLETECGDGYLLQEAQVDGVWQRSDVFLPVTCDTCAEEPTPELPPGHHLVHVLWPTWGKPSPTDGERRTVRYRAHMKQPLTSNLGVVQVPASALLAASMDTLAIQEGGLEVIDRVLALPPQLEDDASDSDDMSYFYVSLWHEAALRRLAELPRDVAVPRLLSLAADDDRTWLFPRVIKALIAADPDAALTWAITTIEGPASALRNRLLKRGMAFRKLPRYAARQQLCEVALGTLDEDPVRAIQFLSHCQYRAAAPTLERLAKDPAGSAASRIHARFRHAVVAGTRDISVSLSLHRATGNVVLQVTNELDEPLFFSYHDPGEFVQLYLSHETPRIPVVSLWGEDWTVPASARTGARTGVTLGPDESHRFTLPLLGYFPFQDPGGLPPRRYHLTATCRAPGAEIPRASGAQTFHWPLRSD